MQSKLMRARVAKIASLLAVIVLISTSAVLLPATQKAEAACSDRMVILLAGINTNYNDWDTFFASILTSVVPSLSYDRPPIRFNYRGPVSTQGQYTVDDTYVALPSLGPTVLHQQVTNIIGECPEAQIDLVGHSLGGVVAFIYVEMFASNLSELRHIKHVVTLDSPINGSSPAATNAWLRYITPLVGSQTGQTLVQRFNDSNRPERDLDLALRLSKYTVFKMLASHDDKVVPYSDAALGDFTPSGMYLGNAPDVTGHGEVLSSQASLTEIRRALQTPVGLPGDLNGDGVVDIFDANIMQQEFFLHPEASGQCGNIADINGNCRIDVFDNNWLVTNFGRTAANCNRSPGNLACSTLATDGRMELVPSAGGFPVRTPVRSTADAGSVSASAAVTYIWPTNLSVANVGGKVTANIGVQDLPDGVNAGQVVLQYPLSFTVGNIRCGDLFTGNQNLSSSGQAGTVAVHLDGCLPQVGSNPTPPGGVRSGNLLSFDLTRQAPGDGVINLVATGPSVTGFANGSVRVSPGAVFGTSISGTPKSLTRSNLVRGSGIASKFNALVFNLILDHDYSSQSVADLICGGSQTNGMCLSQVARWNAASQRFDSYAPGLGLPSFPVNVGDVLFIAMTATAPDHIVLSGSQPAPMPGLFTIQRGSGSSCEFNYISIPFDQGMPRDAEQLAVSLSRTGQASDISQVATWNAQAQRFDSYAPGLGLPPFAVNPGQPYFLCAGSGAKVQWP